MIRLRTLGTLDLSDSEDARDVTGVLGQPMRAGVLACLAITSARSLQSRDRLMGLFWPEAEQARARHALNQTLYALRRDLGSGVFLSRGNDVGVDTAVLECDASRFDALFDDGQLAEALEWYTGDLLDGFYLPGRHEFDQWLETERLRLRNRAIDAAHRLGTGARTAGNLTGSANWLRRAVALSPFDEVILRELIEVLGDAGDRAGALRAYDQFARRLESDFEVDPSPETRALAHRLREQATQSAPSPLPTTMPASAAPRPDPPKSTPNVPRPPRRARVWKRRTVVGGGLVIGLSIIAAVVMNGSTTSVADPPFRVLVPAFRNDTGDTTLDAIGGMAADWIAGEISRAGGIQVVPSLTALRSMPGNGVSDPLEWIGRVADLARETESSVVVAGTYALRGGELAFNATIAEPGSSGTLGTIGPVIAAAGDPMSGIEQLGRQAAGSLAAFADPNLASWVGAASRPPSLEAYEMFADGMDLLFHQTGPWRPQVRLAAERMRAAASLDTSFTLPLVWAVHAYAAELADEVAADTVLRILEARRDALPPWDRAMADYYRAGIERDRAGEFEAMKRVVRLAPSSEWRSRLGTAALKLRRPRAAVRELTALDPDRGWVVHWPAYWQTLRNARHLAGDYEGELADVARDEERHPGLGPGPRLRALIGLGRIAEVMPAIDRILDEGDAWSPAGREALQLALELHAHGHDTEYRAILAKVVSWFDRDAAERIQRNRSGRINWAWSLYLSGRAERADSVFRRILIDWPTDWNPLTGLALTAIARADTAEARRRESAIAAAADDWGESLFYQAAVAAHLGEPDRAARLLRESWADGLGYTVDRHVRPFLDPLRTIPAFQEIFKPIG